MLSFFILRCGNFNIKKFTILFSYLYNIYEYLLNIIDEYRIGKGTINVIFPEEMDVRNANDILFEITEAKKNNLPNAVLVELTKKYLLKKFGKTKEKQKDGRGFLL